MKLRLWIAGITLLLICMFCGVRAAQAQVNVKVKVTFHDPICHNTCTPEGECSLIGCLTDEQMAELTGTMSAPMDVPAIIIRVDDDPGCKTKGTALCIGSVVFACEDMARVLLTSEDGQRHCILFPKQEPK